MKILLDDSLMYGERLFAPYGEILSLPAAAIDSAAVGWADALICRSKVRVDAQLLGNSELQFVGTATAGVDHVDLELLSERGIAFAAAPGRNAESVASYVLASVCAWVLATKQADRLRQGELRAGVFGCGHVGKLVARRLQYLGLKVLVSDPPLQEQWQENKQLASNEINFAPPESVLDADVVCLHTSLVKDGDWPSYHLLGDAELARLPERSLLISCGRGEVVANSVLANWASTAEHKAVVDVWEGEPDVDTALTTAAWLLTPHIAGYSLDGRMLATFSIRDSFLRQIGKGPQSYLEGPPDFVMPGPPIAVSFTDIEAALAFITKVYDLAKDHARFQRLLRSHTNSSAMAYHTMRKDYWQRRDFSSIQIQGATGDAAKVLAACGFDLIQTLI